MRLEKMKDLFPHELRAVLTGGKETEVSKRFASNLFESKKREKLIPIYLKVIEDNANSKTYHDNCVKLIDLYASEFKQVKDKLPKALRKESERVIGVFQKKVGKKNGSKSDSKYESKGEFHKFPKEWTTLSEIGRIAKDHKKLKEIHAEIKDRAGRKDKKLANMSVKDSQKSANKVKNGHTRPFDYNRSGREIPGFFINASDVKFKGIQNYILAGCPQDKHAVGRYYDVVIKQKASVLITTNQPGEGGGCPAFWTNKVLSQVKLRDGWEIQKLDNKTKVLAEGTKPHFPKTTKNVNKLSKDEVKKFLPRIVERHLVAKKDGEKDRKIIHLHYENWHDRKPAPDLDLLETLLDRRDELHNSKGTPIVINCRGGIGRTGTVALADYCRKEIDARLKAGEKLDKIRLNIPEMLYRMRQQRSRMVSSPSQLSQAYAQAYTYYKRLQKSA